PRLQPSPAKRRSRASGGNAPLIIDPSRCRYSAWISPSRSLDRWTGTRAAARPARCAAGFRGRVVRSPAPAAGGAFAGAASAALREDFRGASGRVVRLAALDFSVRDPDAFVLRRREAAAPFPGYAPGILVPVRSTRARCGHSALRDDFVNAVQRRFAYARVRPSGAASRGAAAQPGSSQITEAMRPQV